MLHHKSSRHYDDGKAIFSQAEFRARESHVCRHLESNVLRVVPSLTGFGHHTLFWKGKCLYPDLSAPSLRVRTGMRKHGKHGTHGTHGEIREQPCMRPKRQLYSHCTAADADAGPQHVSSCHCVSLCVSVCHWFSIAITTSMSVTATVLAAVQGTYWQLFGT